MRGVVTVVLHRFTTAARPVPPGCHGRGSTLLRLGAAGFGYDAVARRTPAAPGDCGCADGGVGSVDEHIAAETSLGSRRPDCVDVLWTRRPRPAAEAARRLLRAAGACPGWALAAAPLTGGGWAVLDSTSGIVTPLPGRLPPDLPLLPSCLHAWLVAGHDLRELEEVRVLARR